MSNGWGSIGTGTIVRRLAGDETVLCVAVQGRTGVVIVVNERYPDALAHAERHISGGLDGVLVCRPDCPG